MAEPGRVAVLTNRQPLHYLLIRHLAERFDVGPVIYERQGLVRSVRLMARRSKRIGWGTVVGQLAFIAWDRWYERRRLRERIGRMLAGYDCTPPGAGLPQIEVDSISDEAAAQALEAAAPDVCVVSGTSILQANVLRQARVFLNIHAGITPRYRGAHGAFWAVYEGRPDLAGVTVHVVDAGIDTGGIVAQAPIQVAVDDTLRTLVVKQYLAALPLIVDAVRQALNGTLTVTQRDDLESRLWYSPTPADYWRFRRQLSRLEHASPQTQ